jgi:hypothetical protein
MAVVPRGAAPAGAALDGAAAGTMVPGHDGALPPEASMAVGVAMGREASTAAALLLRTDFTTAEPL